MTMRRRVDAETRSPPSWASAMYDDSSLVAAESDVDADADADAGESELPVEVARWTAMPTT